MLIGLISDTHIPEAGPEIPPQVYKAFQNVDLVLHAGDMHVIDVLNWLEWISPVLGARGNGDYPSGSDNNRPGVPEDPRVKKAHVLKLEGFTLGLTHYFPTPDEMPWTNLEAIMDRIFGQRVEIVICGDTHVELVLQQNGILLVNSGSPTLPHNLMPQLGTVALLELRLGEAPKSEIIHLRDIPL